MKQIFRLVLTIFIVSWLLGSCDSKHDEKKSENLQSENSHMEIFDFPIKKFSLPYDISLKGDSNSLIYLKQVPFDTSYLLHIVKQDSQIRGICYVVLPTQHRDLEDFHDQEHQLLFFDGLSFRMNNKQWEAIKKQTSQLISSLPDTTKNSSPCFDCSTFSIMFNKNKRVASNSKQRLSFKEYDVFIRDSLLYYFFTKRK